MIVSQLMNGNVVSVSPETTVSKAAALIARTDVGSLPVVDAHGKLRGIITDRDIVVRYLAPEDGQNELMTVREIMTRSVVTIPPSADVREAACIMAEKKIRRLPVSDGGRVVGMVSIGDLSGCREYCMEAGKALADISEHR